jgi:hypothetical protein
MNRHVQLAVIDSGREEAVLSAVRNGLRVDLIQKDVPVESVCAKWMLYGEGAERMCRGGDNSLPKFCMRF